MTSVIRVKEGVLFTVISPGGFEIFSALSVAAAELGHDLTITSACDGLHSGPDDPHHFGRAYDVRTHDLTDPKLALSYIMNYLDETKFYGFIEDGGTDNEHVHVQVRHGVEYP